MADDCNALLLEAVEYDNLNEVKRLLQDPNIDLNYDSGHGNTILYESLFLENHALLTCLLDAGYDINGKNAFKETPLHVAAMHSPSSFVQELIKRGAVINAKQRDCLTPLHLAASYNNVESACVLLYYGADANAICAEKKTPLMWAVEKHNEEVAKILFTYFDDFFTAGVRATEFLNFAISKESTIVIDILKTWQDERKYCHSLMYSLNNKSPKMFELIWSEFNEQIYLDCEFLQAFFRFRHLQFSADEWLECMDLLLNSTTAFELLQTKRCYIVEMENNDFLLNLLWCLKKRSVELNDRLAIICLFLSFGIKVTTNVLNLSYLLFGFNEELEAFRYALNCKERTELVNLLTLPRLSSISDNLLQTGGFFFISNGDIILNKLRKVVIDSLGFFSLPIENKRRILSFFTFWKDRQQVFSKLHALPEVPSLVELSRNQSREFICQMYNVKKPYRFYDILKQLNLPPRIKDIISFKTPIY